jgi:hypothetical protein
LRNEWSAAAGRICNLPRRILQDFMAPADFIKPAAANLAIDGKCLIHHPGIEDHFVPSQNLITAPFQFSSPLLLVGDAVNSVHLVNEAQGVIKSDGF